MESGWSSLTVVAKLSLLDVCVGTGDASGFYTENQPLKEKQINDTITSKLLSWVSLPNMFIF